MSGDSEQEYFSDGICEDITTDLSKVSALEVIARNTAFQFKGQTVDVCDVARKLGVSHVLEGSVRKAGDRVRITAQLIDGATGGHIWADRYDRDLTDIFAIQDEISTAIVEALKVKLLPAEKKAIERRGTTSAEAYNLYLMARQMWVSGNYGDVRRDEIVIRTAKGAIALDANYAEAWALLAIAQASLRYHYGRDVDDGLAAAEEALRLNPSLAAAYSVRARHIAEHVHEDVLVPALPGSLHLGHCLRQAVHRASNLDRGARARGRGLGGRRQASEHRKLRFECLEALDRLALGLGRVAKNHVRAVAHVHALLLPGADRHPGGCKERG